MKAFNAVVIVAIILGLFAIYPRISYALDEPDVFEVIEARVFQNTFEWGDWLIILEYNIGYEGADPSYPEISYQDMYSQQAFEFSIYDENGILMASNPILSFGNNIVAIYMTPETAADRDFGTSADPWSTWGTDYELNISGYVSVFGGDPPSDSLFLDATGDYIPTSSADYDEDDVDVRDDYIEDSRNYLDLYIVNVMAGVATVRGETLLAETGGRIILNQKGSNYVMDAIPGIQMISSALEWSERPAGIPERIISSRSYEQKLAGNVTITFCEETDNWSADAGHTISLEQPHRKQGNYSVKICNEEIDSFHDYEFEYNPEDNIEIGARDLAFDFMCTRDDDDFVESIVYLYDSNEYYYGWDFSFRDDVFERIVCDITSPDYVNSGSETIDLDLVDKLVFAMQPSGPPATVEFDSYCIYLDNISARGEKGIGQMTQDAFEGLGDWMGVPGSVVSAVFFLFIYLITASIIFLTTANYVASMIIATPVILFAGLLGVISLSTIAVIVFVLVAVAAFLIWVG